MISEDSSEQRETCPVPLCPRVGKAEKPPSTQGELEMTWLLPSLLLTKHPKSAYFLPPLLSKAVSPRPHTTGSCAGEPRLATCLPSPIL